VNDYDRIAAVIRYLDEHHAVQPALNDLAAAAGLSEFHFHRLFRRWAGITPKDFLQCLTAEHAKDRLRDSASVLDAALDSGLSGPGRLHDLFVTIEAASPGEFKSGGRGLSIEWGVAESPFGFCSLAWNPRGVCHLAFHDTPPKSQLPPGLRDNWPHAHFSRNERAARRFAKNIFNPDASSASLKAFVRATPFQLKVWRALLRIPEGCVASYGGITRTIGNAKAVRAVGSACGANPIAWLIPCHRVIRETGIVQGYRWGTTRKRALLAFESAKKEARTTQCGPNQTL
jgi:AraC family transcriptional regulator, regulatory protein of adaptative response / methylated-DNA-[protein]-cysteine methyltransferase